MDTQAQKDWYLGRLHGALLLRAGARSFLIGDLKEPVDYAAVGFESPGELQPLANRFVELQTVAGQEAPALTGEILTLADGSVLFADPEALARRIYQCLVITRNASVSERLWNLIFDAEENEDQKQVSARWLLEMPLEIWEIVRDQVLRCT